MIDDFGRALKESDKLENSADFEGFRLINNKLNETLKAKGLTQVEVAAGDAFDAEKTRGDYPDTRRGGTIREDHRHNRTRLSIG